MPDFYKVEVSFFMGESKTIAICDTLEKAQEIVLKSKKLMKGKWNLENCGGKNCLELWREKEGHVVITISEWNFNEICTWDGEIPGEDWCG